MPSVLVRLIRMVKTADQIERLTAAAATGELGLHALVEAATPGIDSLHWPISFARSSPGRAPTSSTLRSTPEASALQPDTTCSKRRM